MALPFAFFVLVAVGGALALSALVALMVTAACAAVAALCAGPLGAYHLAGRIHRALVGHPARATVVSGMRTKRPLSLSRP